MNFLYLVIFFMFHILYANAYHVYQYKLRNFKIYDKNNNNMYHKDPDLNMKSNLKKSNDSIKILIKNVGIILLSMSLSIPLNVLAIDSNTVISVASVKTSNGEMNNDNKNDKINNDNKDKSDEIDNDKKDKNTNDNNDNSDNFVETTNKNLISLVEEYEEDLASFALKQQNEPKTIIDNIKRKYSSPRPIKVKTLDELKQDSEKVLTLKAYLDEAERDLFQKNWDNLQVYLYTFADQENAFADLIDGLFPSNDRLDQAAREALSFEAKSMFLALDDLREAAKLKQDFLAQKAYAKLLISYDRFLKAGDLYPTYDPITSTAVFFEGTPKNTLRYDSTSKVQVLDTVLLTSGPDMGKTGTVINIDGNSAVVKLDQDGKAYQEVKYVKINMLAKTLDDKKITNKKKNT